MRWATIVMALAMLWLPRPVAAQFGGPAAKVIGLQKPPQGMHIGSLLITTATSKFFATAFNVSQDGYYVTSYNSVRHALSISLIMENGSTWPITTAVAVNKARDLVLLDTGFRNMLPNMRLDLDAKLPLEAVLLPQPGPRSRPLLEVCPGLRSGGVYWPQIQGKASGEDFLRGLKNDGPRGIGTDPTVEWVMLDVAVDSTYAGAPVWNDDYSRLVGIVTSVGDGTPGLRYVLPLKYVQELVPDKPASIPLRELAKWNDRKQLPPAPDAVKLAAENSATRWEEIRARRTKLAADAMALEQLKDKFADEAKRAVNNFNVAEAQIKRIVPENSIQSLETQTVKEKVKDNKGKEKIVEKKERVLQTERILSPQQKVERSILNGTVYQNQAATLVANLRLKLVENTLLPHTQRRFHEATIELLLAADPLELRDLEDLEPLQQKLDERIQQKSKDPLDYLLRAVLQTRRRNGAAARQDLAEMVRLEEQFTPLRVVLERRLENFEKNTQLSAPEQTSMPPLLESLVPLVAARIEWDNGNGKEAAAILTKWLDKHQRHADVHMALAWELLETVPVTRESNRLAFQYAWNAVELNRGRDWLALGALAGAQIRNEEPGKKTLAYLTPLMPANKKELLAAWQKAVANEQPPMRRP